MKKMSGSVVNTASLAKWDNKVNHGSNFMRVLKRDYQLYLFVLPAVVFLFIFNYLPMYGVQIAFKNFTAAKGIWGSPWVGFEYFERFFRSSQCWTTISNTIILSLYQMIANFPIPIILALMLNHVQHKKFKSFVQTVTYAPHFISMVVLVGVINIILSPRTGFVNYIIQAFGGEPRLFMGMPGAYKHIYVWSGVWQTTGWSSIIYIAALSSVNPELYEACDVDGASRMQKIIHVDLPSILPTAVIMFIMNAGHMMSLGFEKAYLLQNPLTEQAQEIIATYVYKVGLIQTQYSYSTAINLFNTVVNILLLVIVNQVSKRLTETSLW